MKRKTIIIGISILFISGFLILFFSGDQGFMTFYHSRQQINALKKELPHAHATKDSLTLEIDLLKNDTVYLERIAREKYGMARSNETMYKFIEEK